MIWFYLTLIHSSNCRIQLNVDTIYLFLLYYWIIFLAIVATYFFIFLPMQYSKALTAPLKWNDLNLSYKNGSFCYKSK